MVSADAQWSTDRTTCPQIDSIWMDLDEFAAMYVNNSITHSYITKFMFNLCKQTRKRYTHYTQCRRLSHKHHAPRSAKQIGWDDVINTGTHICMSSPPAAVHLPALAPMLRVWFDGKWKCVIDWHLFCLFRTIIYICNLSQWSLAPTICRVWME